MKKIEAYHKKSVVIIISVIIFATFIISVCGIVSNVVTAASGGKTDIFYLFYFITMFLVAVIGASVFFPIVPQVTADENGITCRSGRKGLETVPWDCIKRIYLTENNVLQIEVIDDHLEKFTPAERFNIRLVKKMGGEAVQVSLVTLDVDPLKFTYELQNMLEEYKNAN